MKHSAAPVPNFHSSSYSLVSQRQSVSTHLHQSCYPSSGSLFSAECMQNLFVTQAVWGKLHGSVAGVWELVWALQIAIGAY